MTITHRATTGIAGGTTTGLSFTMPTGHALDDLLVTWCGAKPYNLNIASGTILADYTDRGSKTNGVVANGVGVGSVWAHARTRTHDGTESVPSATLSTTPSPRMSGMSAFYKTNPGAWDIVSTTGSDNIATGTQRLINTDAAINIAPGDKILILIVGPDDTATGGTRTLTASGFTFSAPTNIMPTSGTTAGNDGVMLVIEANVLTGSGTTTLTYEDVLANSDESNAAAIFIRLREPAAVQVTDYWGSAA